MEAYAAHIFDHELDQFRAPMNQREIQKLPKRKPKGNPGMDSLGRMLYFNSKPKDGRPPQSRYTTERNRNWAMRRASFPEINKRTNSNRKGKVRKAPPYPAKQNVGKTLPGQWDPTSLWRSQAVGKTYKWVMVKKGVKG